MYHIFQTSSEGRLSISQFPPMHWIPICPSWSWSHKFTSRYFSCNVYKLVLFNSLFATYKLGNDYNTLSLKIQCMYFIVMKIYHSPEANRSRIFKIKSMYSLKSIWIFSSHTILPHQCMCSKQKVHWEQVQHCLQL